MATEFEIRSEDDLFRAIEMFGRGEWPADQQPLFVGWPRYEVTIRGEDFDGGVPTRIMPALLELQRTFRLAYARSVDKPERRLTHEERKQTELIIRLEPGSSRFRAELAKVLNIALQNMTGREKVVTILGVAACTAVAAILIAQINTDAEIRGLEHRVALSTQETRRLEIVAGLAQRNPDVAAILEAVRRSNKEILKRLDDGDRLSVDNKEIVTGRVAKQIVRAVPQERIADRLDSIFVILSVDSGSIKDGFRIRVRDTENDEEYLVSIPAGTLSDDQVKALQSGEWGKQSLRLEINTERRGKRILKATLISADLSRATN